MTMWDEESIDSLRDIVGLEPYAILAYGSRVAGYASKDSDYDYIYIVEDFKPRIKYVYHESGDTYISVLVVDKSFFEEDIYIGIHGEFVSGRLYSVYKPILNSGYITELEIHLKKRAILEELRLLKLKYGLLLRHMRIPIKYFLLSRLKKRMTAYPPVRYSYYKTFYGEKGAENLRRSIEGFDVAASHLAVDNIFEYSDGYIYNIDLDKIPSSPKELFKYLYRGVIMYFTHGRSASVSLEVVLDEVREKVRRGVRSIRVPKELENPEILIEIRNVYFTPGSIDFDGLVKSIFGYKAVLKGFRKAGLLSNLYILEVEVGDEIKRVVVKNFPIISIFLKWLWLVIWLHGLKRFTLNPWERMYREVDGLITLGRQGFKVPKLYAVVWGDRLIVEEYIKGVRLDRIGKDFKDYIGRAAEMIGYIHSRVGASLGDTKPQNFIVTDGDIYLVDLEQFNSDDCLEWDLAELILYTHIFFRRFGGRIENISSILDGYSRGNPRYRDVFRRLLNIRVLMAFLPLTPVNIFINLRKAIENYL